eukprot:2887866-Rhodomonas_salina.2
MPIRPFQSASSPGLSPPFPPAWTASVPISAAADSTGPPQSAQAAQAGARSPVPYASSAAGSESSQPQLAVKLAPPDSAASLVMPLADDSEGER